LPIPFSLSWSRGRCFSSIVLIRCLPLLAFSRYELLPDSLIQTTNVIPKLNLLNRILIYKLLMSIKIEIRGPSRRCLFLERNRVCIFVSPIEIPQSPFAWKYYLVRAKTSVQCAKRLFSISEHHVFRRSYPQVADQQNNRMGYHNGSDQVCFKTRI